MHPPSDSGAERRAPAEVLAADLARFQGEIAFGQPIAPLEFIQAAAAYGFTCTCTPAGDFYLHHTSGLRFCWAGVDADRLIDFAYHVLGGPFCQPIQVAAPQPQQKPPAPAAAPAAAPAPEPAPLDAAAQSLAQATGGEVVSDPPADLIGPGTPDHPTADPALLEPASPQGIEAAIKAIQGLTPEARKAFVAEFRAAFNVPKSVRSVATQITQKRHLEMIFSFLDELQRQQAQGAA